MMFSWESHDVKQNLIFLQEASQRFDISVEEASHDAW